MSKMSVVVGFVVLVATAVVSGVLRGQTEAKLRAATEKLKQYTQECDDAAFLATLHSCFADRVKSCSVTPGGEDCSRGAMDQCNVIATGAHCTGRKE